MPAGSGAGLARQDRGLPARLWRRAGDPPEPRQAHPRGRYEVYTAEAALDAHRRTPHYGAWQAVADTLDGPLDVARCVTVFPSQREHWGKA